MLYGSCASRIWMVKAAKFYKNTNSQPSWRHLVSNEIRCCRWGTFSLLTITLSTNFMIRHKSTHRLYFLYYPATLLEREEHFTHWFPDYEDKFLARWFWVQIFRFVRSITTIEIKQWIFFWITIVWSLWTTPCGKNRNQVELFQII